MTVAVAPRTRTPRASGLERNQWHQYRLGGGEWLPGATTILRIQDALYGSDGLVNWAGRIAAEETADILAAGGSREQALVSAMASITEARDRGSRVHRGIEALIRDEDHVPGPDTHPYWYGWSRFLLKEKPDILRTEQMLINTSVGYGGTLDIVAGLRGKLAQVDVKTGADKPTHILQLAAYDGGEAWGAPGVSEEPMKLEAHYILALSPTGYQLIEKHISDADREHFAFLAKVYQRLARWKKGLGQ
jgi:hypothetical protein